MGYNFTRASSSGIQLGNINDCMLAGSQVTVFFAFIVQSGASFILSKDNGTQGMAINFDFTVNANSGYAIRLFCRGTTLLASKCQDNAFIVGTPYAAVVTWDGSVTASNVSFYRNGVKLAYALTTNGASFGANTNAPIILCNNSTASSNFVNAMGGILFEMAVWNTMLPLQDIQNLSLSKRKGLCLEIRPSNLKRYYSCDEFPDTKTMLNTSGSIISRNSGNLFGTVKTVAGGNSATSYSEQFMSYA